MVEGNFTMSNGLYPACLPCASLEPWWDRALSQCLPLPLSTCRKRALFVARVSSTHFSAVSGAWEWGLGGVEVEVRGCEMGVGGRGSGRCSSGGWGGVGNKGRGVEVEVRGRVYERCGSGGYGPWEWEVET